MLDIAFVATVSGLLGVAVKDLLSSYHKLAKHADEELDEERLASRYAGAHHIYSQGLHASALEALYPIGDFAGTGFQKCNLRLDGKSLPTGIVGPADLLATEVALTDHVEKHSIVEGLPPTQGVSPETVAQILYDIHRRGLKIWDQAIYRLIAVETGKGHISAQFALDHFMRYRLGIGALLDELIQGLIDCEYDIPELVKNRIEYLPIRQTLLPDGSAVAAYGNRMCAGGIHATLAIQRPKPWNDFAIPIQRRSPITSEGQDMVSPIPQAFHQPMIDASAETEFRQTFLRELFEEIFGGEEASTRTRRLRYDWFTDESPPLRWLKDNADHFHLACTGIGLNLVSGNYEVALTCVIQNPTFWAEFSHSIMANWEVADLLSPMVSTRDKDHLTALLTMPELTGSGRFSLCKALQYLKKVEPARTSAPDFELIMD